MPSDLLPNIVNLAPQVAIVGLFLWFILKIRAEDRIERDAERKMETEKHAEFIKAISATTGAVEATTAAVTSGMNLVGRKVLAVDKKVDGVDHKVEEIHKDHKESKEIIKSMYNYSKTLADALSNKPSGKVEVTVNR